MRVRSLTGAAIAALGVSAGASAQFLEPVDVVHTFTSEQAGNLFGFAIAEMSDIDGDGFGEVLIGENRWEDVPMARAPVGRLVVRSGATGEELHSVFLTDAEQLGFSMADAGDVDGDGVPDFVGGAPWTDERAGLAVVFSGATGGVILRIEPPDGGFFGSAVAGVGDVNGDGMPDLLVGAGSEGNVGANAGRGYVISGADGSVIREYAPSGASQEMGRGAAATGDLNSDGVSEHLLGAPGLGGRAYLFDGATGAELHVFIGPRDSGRFGEFFVAGVGDMTGDGRNEIYIGDYNWNATPNVLAPGRAYVYSGSSFDEIHRFTGPTPRSGLGCGRGAGDVDGDGFGDLIIGHFSSSEGATNAGRVVVYSGVGGGELLSFTGVNPEFQLGFDAVGIGDVTDDGAPDFALSAARGSTVYVVKGPKPCTADLSGDGAVDATDLAVLISEWGASGSADFNGDGVTNAADLAALISAWGPCDLPV